MSPLFGYKLPDQIMTTIVALPTAFLPSERYADEVVQAQHRRLSDQTLLLELLDAIPHPILIVNDLRQIVYANPALAAITIPVALSTPDDLLGLRPGEAFGCEHLDGCVGGCGTSDVCLQCGLAHALMRAGKDVPAVEECRILRPGPDGPMPLDLRVWTRPFSLATMQLVLVVALDVSHERRRHVLEQVFFHDLANSAGLVLGLSSLIMDTVTASEPELTQLGRQLQRAAGRLLNDVESQRQLAAAEDGSLVPHPEACSARALLGEALDLVAGHPSRSERRVVVDPASRDVAFTSDPALVCRVLVNMVKNAMEAADPGDTITVGCSPRDGRVHFWVHNPQYIPQAVQHQIFRRHFSARVNGHGLGTYSMRLLSERYLHGSVTFASERLAGTTFTASYPLHPPATE